jgi:hypothetical protein
MRIDQPRAEKLAAGPRTVGVNGAARTPHCMNAPLPGRLVQFLDRIDLAAHAAGAAAAAGDNWRRGFLEVRVKLHTALVFTRHGHISPTRTSRSPRAHPTGFAPSRSHPWRLADRPTLWQSAWSAGAFRPLQSAARRRAPFRCWMESPARRHECPETDPCRRASSSLPLHSRAAQSTGHG